MIIRLTFALGKAKFDTSWLVGLQDFPLLGAREALSAENFLEKRKSMVFLSLFLDLMLMFGGWSGGTLAAGAENEVSQNGGPHTVHGHLPGPGEHGTHHHHQTHGHVGGGIGGGD